MSIFDSRLFAWLQPRPRELQIKRPPARRARASVDETQGPLFGGAPWTITAPPDHESQWRTQDLDTKTLDNISPANLVKLLVDLSPEVSAGLWNFLRLFNPGWELDVFRPGSEEVTHDEGQRLLDEFVRNLPGIYGGSQDVPLDTVINSLVIGAWLRGGFFAELVLDEDGREPLNIATPDPASARFRKEADEDLGARHQLGQWQNGQWVDLESETVRYVPIDPLPGEPYGRPLVSPALFAALFLVGLLHDLRRVVAQQGYPRLDLAVQIEKLLEIMPATLEGDPEAMQDWVQQVIDEIEDVYEDLEPDDAYVHLDLVEVNRPVGAVDASSLSAIDDLIRALERMASRALKMMPLLLGINDATTETNANRQWEMQAAGIKSIQHLLENLLERLFTLALEAQGIQADVRFRLAELRAAEQLRDAQTEQLRITNASDMYEAGWISQDEAAEMVVGHPADVPEPRSPVNGVNWPFAVEEESRRDLLREIQGARRQIADIYQNGGGP